MNQSINQLTNQPTNQSINQSNSAAMIEWPNEWRQCVGLPACCGGAVLRREVGHILGNSHSCRSVFPLPPPETTTGGSLLRMRSVVCFLITASHLRHQLYVTVNDVHLKRVAPPCSSNKSVSGLPSN
jgi:hypothetical protein